MSYDSETTNIDEIEDSFQQILFFEEPREWFYYNLAHRGEIVQ